MFGFELGCDNISSKNVERHHLSEFHRYPWGNQVNLMAVSQWAKISLVPHKETFK